MPNSFGVSKIFLFPAQRMRRHETALITSNRQALEKMGRGRKGVVVVVVMRLGGPQQGTHVVAEVKVLQLS